MSIMLLRHCYVAGYVKRQSSKPYVILEGTVRLVLLPFEDQGYWVRESVEHTLWEQLRWFDMYVKVSDNTGRIQMNRKEIVFSPSTGSVRPTESLWISRYGPCSLKESKGK